MCVGYASARRRMGLRGELSGKRDKVAEPLQPDYNVAPTKPVYAVVDRAETASDDDAGAGGAAGGAGSGTGAVERELRVMRWGLVPFWAKDVRIGSRRINARAGAVAEKPTVPR